jgi:hypothetical protein
MIDPGCKVRLGIGWVCENHPRRAGRRNWDVNADQECHASVFALTGLMPDISQVLETPSPRS